MFEKKAQALNQEDYVKRLVKEHNSELVVSKVVASPNKLEVFLDIDKIGPSSVSNDTLVDELTTFLKSKLKSTAVVVRFASPGF
ncbi:MAG: hypothetical protein Q8O87_02445 [bacterium]|nr:hypothetical protein [bacterium]